MTSFATIAAAIPSAVASGAGSETFKPMAITLIGGVLVSTLLTLYVVSVTYSLVDRFRKRDQRSRDVKAAFENVGDAVSMPFEDDAVQEPIPEENQAEQQLNEVEIERAAEPARIEKRHKRKFSDLFH